MIQRSRLAEEEGISLVEMLVAIMILGIVMGAMASSLTTSLLSVQRQERQVQATALAAEMAEQAVSLPWVRVGLCETEATTYFSGASYSYSSTDVEPLVLLDDGDDACTGDPVLRPVRSDVEREGNRYAVETVVTWHDDVQDDDESGSDPNSQQDLKRIRVTVSWDHRGAPASHLTETFLAPDGDQIGFRTRVEHASGGDYTYIDNDTSLTESVVHLRLFAPTPQSGVLVRWDTVDGPVQQGMSADASDGKSWVFEIKKGDPEFNVNKLPNAEIVFTFTATDAEDLTKKTIVLDRGLFLIEPEGYGITSVTPLEQILVRDGLTCRFEVGVSVRGALKSDPIMIAWSMGPASSGLSPVETTSTGATFQSPFEGPEGFVAGTSTSFTITTSRTADGQTDAYTSPQPIPVVEWKDGDPC